MEELRKCPRCGYLANVIPPSGTNIKVEVLCCHNCGYHSISGDVVSTAGKVTAIMWDEKRINLEDLKVKKEDFRSLVADEYQRLHKIIISDAACKLDSNRSIPTYIIRRQADLLREYLETLEVQDEIVGGTE